MTDADHQELLRDLLGELPPERRAALHSRLAADPELARARHELAARWEVLELPPGEPVPPGFARRVRAQAEEEERSVLSGGGFLPATLAAGVLAAGLALGAWLGAGLASTTTEQPAVVTANTPATSTPPPSAAPSAPVVPDEPPAVEPEAPPSVALDTVAELEPELGESDEPGLAEDSFADAYLDLFAEEIAR